MAGIWETIRQLLSRLFGGSDTARRLKVLEKMEEQLLPSKRDNYDSLESLKDEIRILEHQAVKKDDELQKASGSSKRIVAGEIERIFREIDRKRGLENIISGNLERISIALAKIQEAKAALKAGVKEEQFDVIAVEIQELFQELRVSDRAARDLEKEAYVAPEASHVDVESRISETREHEQSIETLSSDTQERLKRLRKPELEKE